MTASAPLNVLVVGASYGLLPAAKIALSGHRATVVGRAEEAASLAAEGLEVRFAPEADGSVPTLHVPPGHPGLAAATPEAADPAAFDLVLLAVQEPQAAALAIADLLARIGGRVPVVSIMNLPPPPYLDRIEGLPEGLREGVYADPAPWAALPPARLTLASPDPQAVRPDPARAGLLQVTLASNFRVAPFADPADQALLSRLARDMGAVRLPGQGDAPGPRAPVHVVTRGGLFTPLSKWPMLATGNCRCLRADGPPVSIADAVLGDAGESRALYEAVNAALAACGAPASSLVGFDAYLAAAKTLARPSSLARAVHDGRPAVERIDRMVLNLLRATGAPAAPVATLEAVSALIEDGLARNRAAAG